MTWNSFLRTLVRALLLIGLVLAQVHAAPHAAHAAEIQPNLQIAPAAKVLGQGDLLILRANVPGAEIQNVVGDFGGRWVGFVPDRGPRALRGGYIGLIGIDALHAPGQYTATLTATVSISNSNANTTPLTVSLAITNISVLVVRDVRYVTERVSIPVKLLGTIDPTLSTAEEAQMKRIYSGWTPEQLWQGPLRVPARGRFVSFYGPSRIYNGINLGTYHAGYDISATKGTTVTAAAAGRVAFVGALAIRGTVVVVDHGRGVFTGYFHLNKAIVQAGQVLKVGEKLGEIGTTGRSQGNHLHFELAVGGATIDPGYWLKVALP
jgi:murein DD-endopeptidase MepM/ murein hydrolase activator NlpD